MRKNEIFPDGTPIDAWFYDTNVPTLNESDRQYVITDYNIKNDGRIYTKQLQALIDLAAENGGGVIVIPPGTYLTGALFFRQGVDLYIADGGILKGSDDISDYPLCKTRIEGETCLYYPALVNAEGIDGFTMYGKGVIDGNGLRSWKAFWNRRKWNPGCTNKDEQRPRLVYLSDCSSVMIAGLQLQNSHFWTTHIYQSDHVKIIGCSFFSPVSPFAAPSTDAIDIDACTDVLVKNCYMEVNDDAVVLKGGKGPFADSDPENGANERIIVEDCRYGFCHGCLTCGSESVHNRNIILRRIEVTNANNLLWFKFRPDTPQHYEYISVDGIKGKVGNFININPWTQFFDLKGREDMPLSYGNNITMKNCDCECETFFCVNTNSEQYTLSDFNFENLRIKAQNAEFSKDIIKNTTVSDVIIDKKSLN